MYNFQRGNVVEFSSGQCDMTIEMVDPFQEGDIPCVWFNMTLGGLPNRTAFNRNILKPKEFSNPQQIILPGELKVGDVVKLRSDGPLMTIMRIQGSDFVCIWFDQNQRGPLCDTFSSHTLVKV